MDEVIVDISVAIDQDSMPCCPLCDNEILEWDAKAVVLAHGAAALVHVSCLMEARKDHGI